MKEMSPYAPDRWIRVLNRHFPNLWTGLRKAYQQPSMLGDREAIAEYLSGTPDWCIMPVMVPPLYLSRHYDSNVLQLRLQEAMSIATMYTWRAGKGVYRFEKELYDALVGQPLQGDLPVNSLFHLPEWGVYIETPGLAFEGVPLDGFIAHLDFNLYSRGIDLQLALFPDHAYAKSRNGLWTEQIRHLPRITDPFAYSIATGVDYEYCPDQPRMLAIPLTMGPDDSISNCTLEAALRRVDDVDNLFRTEGPRYNATRESMQRCMGSMMQLLLYLCSDEPDMERPVRSARRVSGGYRGPSEPRVWDVGVRVSRTIRSFKAGEYTASTVGRTQHASPRPHVRSAHWHRYWTGPRTSENREMIIHWIPPLPIGMDWKRELPTHVREVL